MLGNLGITPRLALAFASVAVLAAASNFLVENSVAIVHREVAVQKPVAKPETKPVTKPVIKPVAKPQSQDLQEQRDALQRSQSRVTASQLVVALGKFDKAVREYAEAGTKASANLHVEALADLKLAADNYFDQPGRPRGGSTESLRRTLSIHERTSATLVQVAIERRALLSRYSTILSRMKASLQQSIDKAWKFMGRVVARQSLLKLNAQLDVIQDGFSTRDDPAAAPGTMDRLLTAEQAFSATLEENAKALRRSQGEEWLAGLRNDFMQLSTARVLLAQVEERKATQTRTFAREAEQLARTLALTPESDARPSTPLQEFEVVSDVPATVPVMYAEPTASPVMEAAVPDQKRGSVVAWVSLIVLVLLAYICIATVVGVVRPVRRLIAAASQLAKVGVTEPLASGGIREIDILGQAFNSMAEKLAAAQAVNHEAKRGLELKVAERTRELQDLAERDPLTSLANRRKLFTALSDSIVQAREASCRVGAFVLDIDNFKTLNDSMGHAYGDLVLIAIARRLEQAAQSFGFAARLGGDEFMVVHEGAMSIHEIQAAGNAIVRAFQEPLYVGSRELIVSVSVGASVYPDHEEDAEALLRAADAALFRAKALGRSQLTVFTPELLIAASAKFGIEQRLRRAIEKGEFELFYQPEINVQSFEISLVEALIRWRMPDGSYQGPAEFLAVAEESGLILEINDWVLRTALETAAKWHRGPWPAVRIAVNVSSRQFLDYRFVEKLQALLEEFRLPARCLELELTESVLQTGPTTIKALAQLRAMGVAIALDDFGTGYSSIASLEELPLTRVKLDRSLIARMDTSERSASIARATIGLCSELGLQVTAEGVERLEQFSALLGYGAMSLQGFLLAVPVPGDSLLTLLEKMPAHCHELVLMTHTVTQVPGRARASGAPMDTESSQRLAQHELQS